MALALALLAAGLVLAISLGSRDDDNTATRPSDPPRSATRPATAVSLSLTGEKRSRPRRVGARVGDLVSLQVHGDAPDSVAVVGYDQVQAVDPQTPALFEFVADKEGAFPVRFTSSRRVAGVLVVRARTPSQAAQP